jgi:hypothetical protein
MTTKPPSPVQPADQSRIEQLAYASVSAIPVVEPHDRDRLGYNVWRQLTLKMDSLESAVTTAGARMLISDQEAIRIIRAFLRDKGITV